LQDCSFFDTFFSLLALCVDRNAGEPGNAGNDCRESNYALAHKYQYESAYDAHKAKDESEPGATCLVRHIAIYDQKFQSLTVRALSFRHGHDALCAIRNDLIIFGENIRVCNGPEKNDAA
jgi:hypothetical protein